MYFTVRLLITHVQNIITAKANNGDIIIRSDEKVTFKAGNQIDISATSDNVFDVEPGADFTAIIEDCLCASDGNNICLNYIPPGTPPGQNVGGFEYLYIPEVFDPSGVAGVENAFFSIFYGNQYPMPYNAHRAIFRVFAEGGDLFHEQIINDPCNGIIPGILFWDGCVGSSPAPSAVYTWTLELENCYTETNPVLGGDVTLVNSNNGCNSIISVPDRERRRIENYLEEQQLAEIDKKNVHEYLSAYPNPTHSQLNIEYFLSSDGFFSLILQNEDGKISHLIENNTLEKAGVHEINYNMSQYAKGIYYLTLKTQKNSFYQKLIKI